MKINRFLRVAASMFFVATIFVASGASADSGHYPFNLLKGKNYTKVTDMQQFIPVGEALKAYLKPFAGIRVAVKVDSVFTFDRNDSIYVCLSRSVADYPMRPETVSNVYSIIKTYIPDYYKNKEIAVFCDDSRLEDLVTPFYNPDSRFFKIQSGAEELQKEGKLASRTIAHKQKQKHYTAPLKAEATKPYLVTNGLNDRTIAMSNSHGWYYENSLDRWEWQRARLFETVEDVYTQSYVVPFLVPMLENAGAVVMLPRERDYNKNEVIVDNDAPKSSGYYQKDGLHAWQRGDSLGFADPKKYYVFGENPFRMGTYVQAEGIEKSKNERDEEKEDNNKSEISWSPAIPEDGKYAVYISYHTLPESTSSAQYTVKYYGGSAEYVVNQKMGGGIWIYLGSFYFKKGAAGQGVYLSNINARDSGTVTADACKFGGGMGNMARGDAKQISAMPRFTEGSRYWLQWSGFPDTVYSYSHNVTDYNDDYVSRGKWVNRLAGGSSKLPQWGVGGLKIPVDLSFGFHTDAGTFPSDSIVGTLSIYTRNCPDFGGGVKYPNGEERQQGRYLADIVQTQAVNDVSKIYGFPWTRRGLWDRSYSESRTPQVPGMLLEFLSHENFADMKFGRDPAFRFNVSRALYKGILKFLAYRNNVPYIVQPLPVNNVCATLDNGGSDEQIAQASSSKRSSAAERRKNSRKKNKRRNSAQVTAVNAVNQIDITKQVYAQVTWSAVTDPEEPTANPSKYVVYTAIDDEGFDRGTVVDEPLYRVNLVPGKIYRFKIGALNEGGESFPSETVAAGVAAKSIGEVNGGKGGDSERKVAVQTKEDVVLVVNAFDRVGSAKWLQSKDSTLAGFVEDYDHGVPYMEDAGYIGATYEYRRNVPWTDDDAPGFGSCHGDYAAMTIAGNTFDYAYEHGIAFMKKGYCFASATRSSVENGKINMSDYRTCDIIMGKQAQSNDGGQMKAINYTVYTPAMRKAITDYCSGGRNLLISGAYIATDLVDAYVTDKEGPKFAANVLKFKWMTHSASTDGKVAAVATPSLKKYGFDGEYEFWSELNEKKYVCEAPDAFTPAVKEAFTIFRYPQTNISAAVAYPGKDYKVVSFGFPIETLKTQEQINKLIGQTVDFFKNAD